jgi:hypothetical protein
MDLHAWITQQVDRAERAAVVARDDVATLIPMVELGDANPVARDLVALMNPLNVLRRCEADRRILNRHRIDPARAEDWLHATACHGCGTEGDCDDPVTDNVNDCPELLDLAHAHGITPEILASLDRPTPPEPKPATGRLGLADILVTQPITTSDVPAALRGPRWKP